MKDFVPKISEHFEGIRGCRGITKRRGRERLCAQPAIGGFCWYHNPERPHRFGDGYRADEEKEAVR